MGWSSEEIAEQRESPLYAQSHPTSLGIFGQARLARGSVRASSPGSQEEKLEAFKQHCFHKLLGTGF